MGRRDAVIILSADGRNTSTTALGRKKSAVQADSQGHRRFVGDTEVCGFYARVVRDQDSPQVRTSVEVKMCW